MDPDQAEARLTIASLQAALDVAHEQIRDREATNAKLNTAITQALARAAGAEAHASAVLRRWQQSKRDAAERQNGASATQAATPLPGSTPSV